MTMQMLQALQYLLDYCANVNLFKWTLLGFRPEHHKIVQGAVRHVLKDEMNDAPDEMYFVQLNDVGVVSELHQGLQFSHWHDLFPRKGTFQPLDRTLQRAERIKT
jgi:hypothetical protein